MMHKCKLCNNTERIDGKFPGIHTCPICGTVYLGRLTTWGNPMTSILKLGNHQKLTYFKIRPVYIKEHRTDLPVESWTICLQEYNAVDIKKTTCRTIFNSDELMGSQDDISKFLYNHLDLILDTLLPGRPERIQPGNEIIDQTEITGFSYNSTRDITEFDYSSCGWNHNE